MRTWGPVAVWVLEMEGFSHHVAAIQRVPRKIEIDLRTVEIDLRTVEIDLRTVESDLRRVESDRRRVESDLRRVERDLRGVEGDLRGVEGDLRGVEIDLRTMEIDVRGVESVRRPYQPNPRAFSSRSSRSKSQVAKIPAWLPKCRRCPPASKPMRSTGIWLGFSINARRLQSCVDHSPMRPKLQPAANSGLVG